MRPRSRQVRRATAARSVATRQGLAGRTWLLPRAQRPTRCSWGSSPRSRWPVEGTRSARPTTSSGSVATACMIPAAVAIGRRLPPRGRLRALHAATLGSLAVATAAGPLLVAGVLSFPVSAAASTSAFGVQAAWIGLGSRWLGRNAGLPRRTTQLGQAIAWGALVGAGAAAGSLVAPGALHTRDARRRRCCGRHRLPGRSRVVGAHGPLAGPPDDRRRGRRCDSEARGMSVCGARLVSLPIPIQFRPEGEFHGEVR